MKQQYKNIFSLLLLIAGLVLLSHSVIPHDHHYDVACDTEHHDHHDTDHESPMHCHFLNDVAFDDVVLSFNPIFIKDLPVLYTFIFNTIIEDKGLNQSSLQFIESNNLPDYLVLIEHSPTRGSPLQLV